MLAPALRLPFNYSTNPDEMFGGATPDVDIDRTRINPPPLATSDAALPDEAFISSFSSEPYQWMPTATEGAQDFVIAELLVRLRGADGTPIQNPKYFARQHDAGLDTEIDRKIVPAAIDFAIANQLIGGNRVAAVNIFQDSASVEFFNQIADQLDNNNLEAGHLMLELLEHQTPITTAHISAVAYGNKLGFNFALDDVDPREPHDQERVRQFGPHCIVLKLRREVMRDVRNGVYDRAEFENDLNGMLADQELLVIAEGVPKAHQQLLPLNQAGAPLRLDATQSRYDTLSPP